MDGANNPASFPVGAEQLSKAIDMGYTDEEGNIYYYLFHCYYGQKASDKAFVDKAKQALLTGIEKFPKNERILDGLVQLYTSPEDNVGDPADLIALIDKAIENNPTNVDLWFAAAVSSTRSRTTTRASSRSRRSSSSSPTSMRATTIWVCSTRSRATR